MEKLIGKGSLPSCDYIPFMLYSGRARIMNNVCIFSLSVIFPEDWHEYNCYR